MRANGTTLELMSKRKLPKELNEVTEFSKVFTAILMIALPVIAFLAGMSVQKQLDAPLMRTDLVVQY